MKPLSKNFNLRSATAIGLLALFSCWIVFALLSILFNLVKTIPEEKTWGHVNDQQKKYLLFGDIYLFFLFVKDNTPQTASVILYPHSEELFYRGIYELYPRKMTTAATTKELTKKIQAIKPEFVATYNAILTINGYQNIASFSGQQNNFGQLYKKL